MKANLIKIRRLAGIESIEFKPGSRTIFKGKNGAGKSTALNAIAAALGGKVCTLNRTGEAGEGVVVLDGDVIARRRYSEKGTSTPTVKDPSQGNRQIKSPADYLSGIFDNRFLKIDDFMSAGDAKQLEMILGAMPLVLEPYQLEACGINIDDELRKRLESTHALVVIDKLYCNAEDKRRDVNRDVARARSTKATLEEGMPPEEGVDWQTQHVVLLREEADVSAKLNSIIRDAETNEQRKAGQVELDHTAACREYEARMNRVVEAARKRYQRQLDAAHRAKQAALDQLAADKKAAIKNGTSTLQTDKERLISELSTAKERADQQRRTDTIRENIQNCKTEIEEGENKATILNAQLSGLRQLKQELLTNIPIEDMTISDGKLLIAGVPYNNGLNDGKRAEIAVQVCLLNGSQIVLVDRWESLDSTTRQHVYEAAESAGAQLFMAERTEGDLEIVTE